MGELVPVRILDFPLDVYARGQEHYDELVREFVLIAQSDTVDRDVPRRLLELIEVLTAQYQTVTQEPEEIRDAALARGELFVDLLYEIPVAAGDACRALDAMLDEADDFCRSGALLTLASPSEARRFRHWYLGEFVRQVDGSPPTPWPSYDG